MATRTRSPIWLQLLATVAAALAVVWAGGLFWQDRANHAVAIEQAEGFSLSMHDATMAGLTGMMVTGTVAQRAVFLDQIRQLHQVRDVRVLRSEGVSRFFGPGTDAAVPDALEQAVLASGQAVVRVEQEADGEVLRAVRPTLNQKNYLGKDCTVCHLVPVDSVLGVVSMKMSLDSVNAALARQRMTSLLVAVLTAIPVLLVLHPFIRRMVTRPLENGVALAQDIAQGRLDRPVSVDSNNEIGQMQQALRDMRDSLARVVGRVRRGTDAVASASGRIEAGNADLTHSTQSQTQALQRTTESIAQLSAAARQNADSASQGRQLVESATRVATEGSAVVSRAVATMDTIQGASARIQDIVGVIDGIAFQTNILALNAAVEASRAGEQGRGFAVVAAEVRSLALRSTQAAGQIKTLIQDSVQQVDSGTRLVHQAGATVQAIHASVQQVQQIMGEINAASLHQLQGIDQVNDAMAQMAGATQRNTELVHQAETATRALHDQAAELEAAVGLFQLGDRPASA